MDELNELIENELLSKAAMNSFREIKLGGKL